jgi:hypothetical protein
MVFFQEMKAPLFLNQKIRWKNKELVRTENICHPNTFITPDKRCSKQLRSEKINFVLLQVSRETAIITSFTIKETQTVSVLPYSSCC